MERTSRPRRSRPPRRPARSRPAARPAHCGPASRTPPRTPPGARSRPRRRPRPATLRTSAPGNAGRRAAGSRGRWRPPRRAPATRRWGAGSSSARSETLTPMPTTMPSPANSPRMPPVLRSPPSTETSRSLGHLSDMSTPADLASPVAAATPASSGTHPPPLHGDVAGLQVDREEQPGAGRGGPAPLQPPAPGGLLLGDQHRALARRPGTGAFGEVGVGGAGGLHDLQRRPQRAGPQQSAAQRGHVQGRAVEVRPAVVWRIRRCHATQPRCGKGRTAFPEARRYPTSQ